VTWSPTSASFAVVYGYMPAKTVVFNARAEPIHTFPLGPRNTVLFSPHGRFVLVAGFGNLAGQMDIYDLEKNYLKICTIEASNASVCEWSPDGKHILTATTSPRLRVDNGIRIWHAGGPLMFNEDMNELYHVCWRPQPTSMHPIEANPFSPIPPPHVSASNYLATKKTPSKPAGAYRPPGARGQVTPLAFKREDEGGAAYVRDESYANGGLTFGKPRPRVVPGAEPAEEHTRLPPGAAPGGGVSLTGTGEGADGEPLSKAARKNAKKREAKKAAAAAAAKDQPASTALVPDQNQSGRRSQSRSPSRSPNRSGDARKGHDRSRSKGYIPAPGLEPPTNGSKKDKDRSRDRSNSRRQGRDRGDSFMNGTNWREPQQQQLPPKQQKGKQPQSTAPTAPTANTTPPSSIPTHVPAPLNIPPIEPPPIPSSTTSPSIGPSIDITTPTPTTPYAASSEKKIRGLLKKIRAIEDLKMRLAGGEKLEDTQIRKIESEDGVRGELNGLGYFG
jgi:translation initiation factor 2A